MSIGYSSAFMEGINIAKEFIAENFQKQQDVIETPRLQEKNNNDEQTKDEQSVNEPDDNDKAINSPTKKDYEVFDQEEYNKYYRTETEYKALQRKGINVNNRMSYNDDAIDGEFLSKLNEYEFDIDVPRNKLTIFLGIDVKGNVAFKEYDLTSADSIRVKYGSAENNDIWNQKYQASLSEQMKIQRKTNFPYEEFKKNELKNWKSYEAFKKYAFIHPSSFGSGVPIEESTKYSLDKDSDLDHYLRSKYNSYIENGETSTSLAGFEVHKVGRAVNGFKANNPVTSRVLANTYDDIILPFEIFGEYFLVPFIKGNSEVGDMLWDIAIGKERAEYLHQKERKFWSKAYKHYDKIKKDCTPEQKEAVTFALKATEVGGVAKLYKDLAKAGFKQIFRSEPFHVDATPQTYHHLHLEELGNLPGVLLPDRPASTFAAQFSNRLLQNDEIFYRYHGVDNRVGNKYSYFTNKKYNLESELRSGLAIEDSWGIKITHVSEFRVPAGTWVSEGKAGSQVVYKGGDYQPIISNAPKKWIIKTTEAFKNE